MKARALFDFIWKNRTQEIVAKNRDMSCNASISRLDLRPLTNELGGRLDYGQPWCCFHA